MRLPQVSYADGIKTAKQDEFAGLNHNLGAKDGELWDMRNLCSDYSPLLATRSRRMLYKTLQDPGGLFCWDKLCWVDGTTFYYDGVEMCIRDRCMPKQLVSAKHRMPHTKTSLMG